MPEKFTCPMCESDMPLDGKDNGPSVSTVVHKFICENCSNFAHIEFDKFSDARRVVKGSVKEAMR